MNAGLKDRRGLGTFGLPLISVGPENGEVHLSHFTPKVLDRLLENAGFSVVKRTLDAHYIVTGYPRLKANIYYYSCLAFMQVFRWNIYDTMLVIARKSSAPSAERPPGTP